MQVAPERTTATPPRSLLAFESLTPDNKSFVGPCPARASVDS